LLLWEPYVYGQEQRGHCDICPHWTIKEADKQEGHSLLFHYQIPLPVMFLFNKDKRAEHRPTLLNFATNVIKRYWYREKIQNEDIHIVTKSIH